MNTSNQQITLNVQGMTCRSCTVHVERALNTVAGVKSARVDLATKTAVIVGSDIEPRELLEAVQDAGYIASAAAEACPSGNGEGEKGMPSGCCK
jgi:copper chaperone CopZ